MKNNKSLFSIAIYLLFFLLTLLLIKQFWYANLFNSMNFTNWDAKHYLFIKEHGYQDFRIAFFPLFPLIWKGLSLGIYGIVILNATLFIFCFYLLIKTLKINSSKEILLYLSIPSFIFFYLPYSESLFFLCSTLIIIGLKNKINYMVYLGLFFAILCRPAFTVFIPALILTEFLSETRAKIALRIFIYFLIAFAGIMLVGVIQHADTGEWFKFFEVQKEWGNHLQIPKLPLDSWAGGFIVKTDGFAFLIGAIAGSYLLVLLLKAKRFKAHKIPKEVIFSLAYLGGITLLVLLFRGGLLFSLNRFIFATPFIIVVLNYWIHKDFSLKNKHFFLIFGLLFFFWFLFGSYVHIQQILKFSLLSLFVLLLFILKSEKESVRKWAFFLLIATCFTLQITFLLRFLTGYWVG